jgi:hypothetical protein
VGVMGARFLRALVIVGMPVVLREPQDDA